MPPNCPLSGFYCTLFSKVTLFSLPEVLCGPQLCQKRVGPGLHWGAHDAAQGPLVGWGGDIPSPIPMPFGASILASSALSFCGPPM